MAKKQTGQKFPDGIGARELAGHGWHRHASPTSLLLLGSIVAIAFTGMLGGAPRTPLTAQSRSVRLRVDTPHVMRNGELFETRVEVAASRPIADLVLAITPELWRDMTVNTMIPAPVKEAFSDGAFRLSYGPLDAGDVLKVKIDGQINPSRFGASAGTITALDGDAALVRVALETKVRP